MSRTVSIDVFRLATMSPYFKHFIQSLGQPIDYIPRELEVSFVVFDSMDTEEAIVQCTLFLNLLQDREYEERYSALLIYILQYVIEFYSRFNRIFSNKHIGKHAFDFNEREP